MQKATPNINAARDLLLELGEGLFEQETQWYEPCEVVDAEQMSESFRTLLVHEEHMTRRLEAIHRRPVELRVLQELKNGDAYARRILLALENSGQVVEFGLMRFNLVFAEPDVKAAVLACERPLGDILIGFDVLRRAETHCYLRFGPGCPLLSSFQIDGLEQAFGRVGRIYYDQRPVIDVLEVVTDGQWVDA